MATTTNLSVKLSFPWTRRLLYLAGVLVVIIGISLYLLTESTDVYFSWTIQSSLTAAFIGAGYWASFLLEFLSARERVWARARLAMPAVVIFSFLMFIATLIHLDKFHFNAPQALTVAGTWVWFLVYAIVPVLLAVQWWRQVRAPGVDPARGEPLPGWMRALLIAQAAIMLLLGVVGTLAPDALASIWPWALTPLTGRAVGAWCVGLGVAAAHAVYENDLLRLHAMMTSCALFGLLAIVALLRYPAEINTANLAIWIYVAFIASLLLVGIWGTLLARRALRGRD
ncbi:MAG: hypothetical protein IT320_09550 [Anaerolineae bacterium]|nr:hypothetical protein [Anaerolineae bacterium]